MTEWSRAITVICTVVLACVALATLMRFEHAGMRTEIAAIRDQLNSVDRRTASIEGHLFGIEIGPDQQAAE